MRSAHTIVAMILVGLFWLAQAQPADAQVRIEDPESNVRLSISGWIQPRYELTVDEGGENLSSFYLRRVRLDIRGSVFAPGLTFRIMPELRSSSLRDAFVNYAYSPTVQVRVGQFALPFGSAREISGRRQHFVERGEPGETFGFPDGRDIGVMLHGSNVGNTWRYGVGVFDGAGRNTGLSTSTGHVLSARGAVAVVGRLPEDLTDHVRSPSPMIGIGAGVQAANKSDVREWDLGRAPGNARGDWLAATADLAFRLRGFSLASEVHARWVAPEAASVDEYVGAGMVVSSGYFVLPQRLELVGRYSTLALDLDDAGTSGQQWAAGLNLYHRGHDLKTQIQYFHTTGRLRPSDVGALVVQLHVQF